MLRRWVTSISGHRRLLAKTSRELLRLTQMLLLLQLLLLLLGKHDFGLELVVNGHFVIERLLEMTNFLSHERNLDSEPYLVLTLSLLLLPHFGHLMEDKE